MFILKKHLDRRTFLRGMGAAVALPLLDAMIPARTALAATAARPAPRRAFVYFPHGAVMAEWTPAAEGPITRLGRILEPLTPFVSRLTIVSGLENRHALGPVHAITPGTWLAGVSPREALHGGDGTTADQVAADHLGGDTRLASIALAAEPPNEIGAGPWEGDYPAAYGTTISFRGTTPVTMEVGARRMFDRLFLRGDACAPAPGLTGTSVLDLVAGDAARLHTRLGSRDRAALRDYFDTIRDVECRVERAETLTGAGAGSIETVEAAFTLQQTLMFDLVALAFRADLTRVASMMMAAETSAMTYRAIGVPEPFHLLSHHQNDPVKLEALVRIQRHHTRLFAGFVHTLAAVPDGDGSLLDQSLILYGSNMSDSQRHDHYPLPLAVVGGGSGAFAGGRHVREPDGTPIGKVCTLVQST